MTQLTINETKDGFIRNGKPFFYLADTVWSIFSNTSLEDWKEYLEYRRQQPFNALQISILPILHDTSDTYVGIYPFHTDAEGNWDFYRINDAFFDKAEQMVKMATDCGFTCSLVVLWANYVPNTTFSRGNPSHIMPFDAVRPYTEYVAKRFVPYHPIYFISGDTDFGSEETVAHYMEALKTVKEITPEALTTLHLGGSQVLTVERFVQEKQLDFYMYQSGHCVETQQDCYKLAEGFYAKAEKRPIVNGEPAYEGHGHGNRYGRFGAFDVRRAFWWSVLSGAKAGFTYGAHGLFSWHRKGAAFTSESWSKIPYDWRTALRFEGAWDAGYCKWLFETNGLQAAEPANAYRITPYEDIRVAVTPGLETVAVYIPYSNDVRLSMDLTGYQAELFDLERKRCAKPVIDRTEEGSVIRMHDFTADVLVVARRERAVRS